MKIEKTKSREYHGKQYFKYRVIIPEKVIEQANFKEGDELQAETKKGEIKLKNKER
jgi:bifunctional DNA-binding transcriptional regulator/antitoxin component of YhaV-PrlF toxin-antitoxin module